MDKRKIIKVILIIFCVIFAFALVEVLIRNIFGKVNEYTAKKEEDKKQEQVYNSSLEKAKRQVEVFINNINKAIQDEDFDYIFLSLDDTYKECMFNNDINKLKEYIENNINLGSSYSITDISTGGGFYQVLVGIKDGDNFFSQRYTVKVISDTECRFMFDEYYGIKKVDEVFKTSDLSYKLVYYYETSNVMSYLMDLTNLTSEDINIELKDISAISITGSLYNGILPESFILETGETKRIDLGFLKKFAQISVLKFNIIVNGEERNYQFSLGE